ncbi:MAG: polyprenyl synthetase family protein [Spirochaetes bacterium]|nr:polyprenyl synthetase family protein [Spirochaetota bacterium]
MLTYLAKKKSEINDLFQSYLLQAKQDVSRINSWGPDALNRLQEYLSRGKMIRGSLVSFGHEMCGGTRLPQALQIGAAMELFQAAFLIHDDIMDQDLYRRGKPSIHAQYRDLLKSKLGTSASLPWEHIADSLGICVGDIALFLAFELLGSIEVSLPVLQTLLKLFTRELLYVGFAQMEDVYFGGMEDSPSEEQILSLYTYKTGRYTFSLPLMAGGILADAQPAILNTLSRLGERMGILFQLKDDELGIFGDTEEVGKPVGSDVISNKKTLYRYYLFQIAKGEDRTRIEELFGAKRMHPEDLLYLRTLIKETKVQESMERLMNRMEQEARTIIQQLEVDPEWKEKLIQLVEYNRNREK